MSSKKNESNNVLFDYLENEAEVKNFKDSLLDDLLNCIKTDEIHGKKILTFIKENPHLKWEALNYFWGLLLDAGEEQAFTSFIRDYDLDNEEE